MPTNTQKNKYIAHVRKKDNCIQSLETHLREVGNIAERLANKIKVPKAGGLIGFVHDFGKYPEAFQTYIKSGTGLLDADDIDYVDAALLKGKIDHSTAGAQLIYGALKDYGPAGRLCGQILALCVVSHHSGLIDCLRPDGGNGFNDRIEKLDSLTHLNECKKNADPEILTAILGLADKSLIDSMITQIKLLSNDYQHDQEISESIKWFYIGFWTRFLFSCLIDADRISSADFENPDNIKYRNNSNIKWPIDRMEDFLAKLPNSDINDIRRNISDTCKEKSSNAQGIFTLTVPTGGGKNYAALRFALHHAAKHKLERIIYIVPYTSIIEQNAEAIREVIEREGDAFPWIVEHHSNLEPENQTWHSKLASENWDAPIIMTTMVQFLDALFSGGTRGVRRLHQLANSVIIFDEIQTLPINCTHLFCNALNFLSTYTNTTAVLCTATQPLLDQLPAPKKGFPSKGQLLIPKENELIDDVTKLFDELKRVEIIDKTREGGWSKEDISELAVSEFKTKGSCLVVTNTKSWAKKLYTYCYKSVDPESIFHLSTNQCAAHRSYIIRTIKKRLKEKMPVLCFSTQLIEAGVDIDFASAVRFQAGLDSIAQTAGRVNRNGLLDMATVFIVNPDDEPINQLTSICVGQEVTTRILGEVKITGESLLDANVMDRYFKYYFYDRADEMVYPLTEKKDGIDGSLLNLLGSNEMGSSSFQLKQSFMTAGNAFKAIDTPSYSVIVPYKDGKDLIKDLCGISKEFNVVLYYKTIKKLQKFSVNVFPHVWKKLLEQNAVYEISPGEGVYYLDETYYSDDFGLSIGPMAL